MLLNRFKLDLLIMERDRLAADLAELKSYRANGQHITITEAEVAVLETRLKALIKVTGAQPLRPPTTH